MWFDVHTKLAPKMWAPNNMRVRMLCHRRSTIFVSGKITNRFPHHWLSPPEEVNELCTWNTAVGCEQTLCFYLFIQVNFAQGSRTAIWSNHTSDRGLKAVYVISTCSLTLFCISNKGIIGKNLRVMKLLYQCIQKNHNKV